MPKCVVEALCIFETMTVYISHQHPRFYKHTIGHSFGDKFECLLLILQTMRQDSSARTITGTGVQFLAHIASYTMDTKSHSFGNGKRLVRKALIFMLVPMSPWYDAKPHRQFYKHQNWFQEPQDGFNGIFLRLQ